MGPTGAHDGDRRQHAAPAGLAQGNESLLDLGLVIRGHPEGGQDLTDRGLLHLTMVALPVPELGGDAVAAGELDEGCGEGW